MPGAAKTLLFILILPFLAGLGHDVYINYFSDNEKIRAAKNLQIDPDDFMLSDVGWIWNQYSPITMEAARDTVGPEKWKRSYNPILQQSTLFVTIIPFLCGVVFLAITFILGIWPFSRFGRQRKEDKKGYGVYKKAKTKKFEYKKK